MKNTTYEEIKLKAIKQDKLIDSLEELEEMRESYGCLEELEEKIEKQGYIQVLL